MMHQRASSPGPPDLDESMDNMESLILHPPDDIEGSSPVMTPSYFGSHAQEEDDDPLGESDFTGFGQGHGYGYDPGMEPPPYSEALHAPRVGATSASTSSSSSPRHPGLTPEPGGSSVGQWGGATSASGTKFVSIKVTDPQKHLDSSSSSMLPGGGTYVSYAVITRTNIPEFWGSGAFRVRRRFKEFVALADRLAETHRGFFLPSRPDKSVVENQLMAGKDFVEMRRVELEKYLHRLARHPDLARSRELVLFLTTEGKLPMFPKADVTSRVLEGVAKLPGQLFSSGPSASSVPAPSEAVQPASGGNNLLRMFKEFGQSVANDWVGGGGANAPSPGLAGSVVVDPQEEAFEARRHRLEELEKHITEASIQAENLVRAQADLTRVTGNLGLSFLALSKLQQRTAGDPLPGSSPAQQEVHRHLAEASKAGGSVLVKESRVHQQAVSESISQLAQLHEYLKGLQSARHAFADRTQAVVTVQTLSTDLASKRARQDRLNAQGPSRPGDMALVKRGIEVQEEIDKAQRAKAAAAGELERIKERNAEELRRFDQQRREDMSSMLESFARIQCLASEKAVQLWEASSDTPPFLSKGKAEV